MNKITLFYWYTKINDFILCWLPFFVIFQDDNSVPLFKIIKQSDSEYTSFIPKSFCVKSEQYDESTATEPEQFAR